MRAVYRVGLMICLGACWVGVASKNLHDADRTRAEPRVGVLRAIGALDHHVVLELTRANLGIVVTCRTRLGVASWTPGGDKTAGGLFPVHLDVVWARTRGKCDLCVPAGTDSGLVQEAGTRRGIRGEQLRPICVDERIRIRKVSLVDPRVNVVDATGRVVREVSAVGATAREQLDGSELRRVRLGAARVGVKAADVGETLRRRVGAGVVAIRELLLADLSESPGKREGRSRPAAECDDDAGVR